MSTELFKPGCIRLFSGKYLDLMKPEPSDIFLIDIAVGLARECRWGNHCKKFYSVAEHSIECMLHAEMSEPENPFLAFECLMHDAHEAYLGDIPTPFKNVIPHYEVVAKRVQEAINIRFGINSPYYYAVKTIDEKVLLQEWKGKMLNWTGFELNEKARVDLFIHHAIRLCQHPVVIMP